MELNFFIIITAVVIFQIVVMAFFFWRQHKKQEKLLDEFLVDAKSKLSTHKEEAHSHANRKVVKAFELIKRLQGIAEDLESQASEEYEDIIDEAKRQRKEILEEAETKASQFDEAVSVDLDKYKQERFAEVEKNLVKLVMSVTEKVVGRSLSYDDHLGLIDEALDEVKKQKQRI